MDGMEKIAARIRADAEEEIARLNEQTRQTVQEILGKYEAQGAQESEAILARGRAAADERLERLSGAVALERRKLELETKQQLLEEAFSLALDKLCALPEQECVALLADMAVRAATTGREELIFSAQDRERIGKQVVAAANAKLVEQAAPELTGSISQTKVGALLDKVVKNTAAIVTGAGQLTLSEQTRPIRGGFILSDGAVEVNCAFETLVRMQREGLERQVAELLFA